MNNRPVTGRIWQIETPPRNKKNNVRFQVLTAASMMFRIVFWDVHGSTSQKTILNKNNNIHRPDAGSSTSLWNVGLIQREQTALHPRKNVIFNNVQILLILCSPNQISMATRFYVTTKSLKTTDLVPSSSWRGDTRTIIFHLVQWYLFP
jgi:hypothetical protein